MNHEGYRDPTADRAVRKADKMPKHIRRNPVKKQTTFSDRTFGSRVTQVLCTSIIFPNPMPTTKENR